MADLIPVVADTPSTDPKMGFDAYAGALAEAIRGGLPAQFTIGIYGSWGTGKSSLLNAIQRQLEGYADVLCVPFDAWRYEHSEHIVVPLLHAIHKAAPRLDDPSLTQKVGQAVRDVLRGLTLNAGLVSMKGEVVAEAFERTDGPFQALDDAYERPFAAMRDIGRELDGRRFVVLIDDLDRCSANNVVSVLEAINLVMDVPGFVFVLALDYDVLVQAIAHKYPHTSGHTFIEKMVQVPFRVPPLDLDSADFLEELVPGWTASASDLPMEFTQTAHQVATLGLRANPRQVKRFVNSLLVLLRVARARSTTPDLRILAGLVGLQLSWPASYQDFAYAVHNEDVDPLSVLASENDSELQRYLEALFDRDIPVETFRIHLHLTQTVASPEAQPESEPDAERRSAKDQLSIHLGKLRAALAQHSFVESEPGIWRHESLPAYRVKIAKTVVRFEILDRDHKWVLGVSLPHTRDPERALELVADRRRLREEVASAARSTHGDQRFTTEW